MGALGRGALCAMAGLMALSGAATAADPGWEEPARISRSLDPSADLAALGIRLGSAGASELGEWGIACRELGEKALARARDSGLGERLGCELERTDDLGRERLARIEEEDRRRRASGEDPKAEPSEWAGVARVLPERYAGSPAFGEPEEKAQAALLIGGVRGTWHMMDGWMADIKARTSGEIYAYEGLDGPGRSPHNERYMKENVKAIADALEGLADRGVKRLLVQTYSMGGIAGLSALRELESRGVLERFERVEMVALAPPFGGYEAADAMRAWMPGALVDWAVNPLLKLANAAMSDDMGPSGKRLSGISGALPGNVRLTAVLGVGDAVATPGGARSLARQGAILEGAESVKFALAGHDAPVDPKAYARQGVDPYAKGSMASELAREGIAAQRGAGAQTHAPEALARLGEEGPGRVRLGDFRERARERQAGLSGRGMGTGGS